MPITTGLIKVTLKLISPKTTKKPLVTTSAIGLILAVTVFQTRLRAIVSELSVVRRSALSSSRTKDEEEKEEKRKGRVRGRGRGGGGEMRGD